MAYQPTDLEVVFKLCEHATTLPDVSNFERNALRDIRDGITSGSMKLSEVISTLQAAHQHAFRDGWTEDRPESWIAAACLRLMQPDEEI